MDKNISIEQVDSIVTLPLKHLITLDDLLSSDSEVLQRIGRELEDEGLMMGGHQSSTSGHRSNGSHSSHSSSTVESPLAD